MTSKNGTHKISHQKSNTKENNIFHAWQAQEAIYFIKLGIQITL